MMLGGGTGTPSPAMDGPQASGGGGGASISFGSEGDMANGGGGGAALRFEDLTIDDDLPLLDRVVRYCRSGIALQRLVHVKMLSETAESVGTEDTFRTLIPLLPPLVSDPESIIRQHLASQLLPLGLTCMFGDTGQRYKRTDSTGSCLPPSSPQNRTYNERGYKIVTGTILAHLNTLISDADVDVRRAASESLASLALFFKPEDVAPMIVPIPLRLSHDDSSGKSGGNNGGGNAAGGGGDTGDIREELRITAGNLLGELAAATTTTMSTISRQRRRRAVLSPALVAQYITPAVLSFCEDGSFRVRRSAVQALPRVLGASSVEDAEKRLLPAFVKLSRDDMYRVRKSAGECLVDMSRSLMLIADAAEEKLGDSQSGSNQVRKRMRDIRRSVLVPIAAKLLGDANKFVRHGMMQFLGPFLASFYPLTGEGAGVDGDDYAGVIEKMIMGEVDGDFETSVMAEGTAGGIGAQFFPHASSMVSRLNSSNAAANTTATPTPVGVIGGAESASAPSLSESEKLRQLLPPFLQANSLSLQTLRSIVRHRDTYPPDPNDIDAVKAHLLSHFVDLARVSTGDENTDAEMRVYCAYSFPAVVLLLGRENWRGMLRDCFVALANPGSGEDAEQGTFNPPPLPVKRCLASSLHTVAHILGRSKTESDLIPIYTRHFFRDSDESVRLNVIRNFPPLLSLLSLKARVDILAIWCDIVRGEEVLGAHRRSVTNPSLLNWRQRDAVARSLPDMLGLFDPKLVRTNLWPIIQMLLVDSVSLVRADAEWCIPVLFCSYCPENVARRLSLDSNGSDVVTPSKECKRWSYEACGEVISWLKEKILGGAGAGGRPAGSGEITYNGGGSGGNFSKRQLYCRICASVGLAIRLGGDEEGSDLRAGERSRPYQRLTPSELKHLHQILVRYMLPPALQMKDDRVSNVRLTLNKVLRIMPEQVRNLPEVSVVIRELEDEAATWDNFYGNEIESGAIPVAKTVSGGANVGRQDENMKSAAAPSSSSLVPEGRSLGGAASDDKPSESTDKQESESSVDAPDETAEETVSNKADADINTSTGSNSRNAGIITTKTIAEFVNSKSTNDGGDREVEGSSAVGSNDREKGRETKPHIATGAADGAKATPAERESWRRNRIQDRSGSVDDLSSMASI